MAINYLPNDPLAKSSAPMVATPPHPKRAAGRGDLIFSTPSPAEKEFKPGTPEFLFWQSREAGLRAIDTWEVLTGNFTSWQAAQKIPLHADAGEDLNAFYDRASLSFFHQKVGTKTYFSGASTDVVAHEAGHGFLDSIRPDFWDSFLFEVNSFHEAFGDCTAILTALFDPGIRKTVLSKVATKNFVEGTAEELSAAIKKAIPGHNAGTPRRARNKYQWAPPETLPADGGPGVLIQEIHSFCQIFTGCFYDLVVNLFQGTAGKKEADLLDAATLAGKLLVKAATQTPQKSRFFQEVGRTMTLIDQQENAGKNHEAIRLAFDRHGIALGSNAMLAPVSTLAGSAPTITTRAASITAATQKDLRGRLDADSGARIETSPATIAGTNVAASVHYREVSLDACSEKLKGVVAQAPETVLLGAMHGRAAVLGSMPQAATTQDDVESFVRSLVKHGAIQFGAPRATRGIVAAAAAPVAMPSTVTHMIKEVNGQKVLIRVRFACGCRM